MSVTALKVPVLVPPERFIVTVSPVCPVRFAWASFAVRVMVTLLPEATVELDVLTVD